MPRRHTTSRRAFLQRTATLVALPSIPVLFGADDKIIAFEGSSRRRAGRLRRSGLEGRREVDLTRLTPDRLVVDRDAFFVRTACPDRLPDTDDWTVRVHGLVERERRTELAEFLEKSRPMGTHLVECSGRGLSGLISATTWTGVPALEMLDRFGRRSAATRVLISGFDDHSQWNRSYDERGCNWVFTLDDLERTGAFFATGMQDGALPRHNGFPLRLVVPGWYGCTCVKWVDEIRFVDDSAPATRHMRQFARRTHQRGAPRKARDFRPAEIDVAAMPVRVERSTSGSTRTHRIVGILWGGAKTTDRLMIEITGPAADGTPRPVERYEHATCGTWSLWSHTWEPKHTGRYTIRLSVADPSIRTRRLDRGDYARRVTVDSI